MANCSPSCQRRFSSVSSGQRLFGSSWPTSKSCRRFLGFRCNAFEENPNWQLTYAATLPEAKRANAVSNIRSVRHHQNVVPQIIQCSVKNAADVLCSLWHLSLSVTQIVAACNALTEPLERHIPALRCREETSHVIQHIDLADPQSSRSLR
jgi:hypothetical protein